VIPDALGGPPGLVCLPNKLIIRYRDVAFAIERDSVRAFEKVDRMQTHGDHGMAEYDLVVVLSNGHRVTIAEAVDLPGQDAAATSDRMSVIVGLAGWLNDVWLPAKLDESAASGELPIEIED
jgi:hypothetical protein